MTTLAHLCGITAIALLLITGYMIAKAWRESSRERHERWWD